MRTKFLGLLALLFIASPAFAVYLSADSVNLLNDHFGPVPRQVRLGDHLNKEVVKEARFTYDFSTDGGTIGNILPLASSDTIPNGAIILYGVLEAVTAVAGSGAALGFQCGTGYTNIKTNTAITSYSGAAVLDGVGTFTAANAKKISADCRVTANIVSAAITAGKVIGHVVYFVTQ